MVDGDLRMLTPSCALQITILEYFGAGTGALLSTCAEALKVIATAEARISFFMSICFIGFKSCKFSKKKDRFQIDDESVENRKNTHAFL